MKTILRIILLVFFVGNVGVVLGADHVTNPSANWDGGRYWVDNDSWVGDAPDPIDLNQESIDIGNDNHDEHYVTRNGNIIAKNNIVIHIYKNSTLKVTGDVTVQNNLEVIVDEGGKFIVDGDINMQNNATLTVDGDLSAKSITEDGGNNSTIEGTGNIYLEEDTNVNTDDFEGVIAEDVPNDEIPVPENLTVSIDSEDKRKVHLLWDYDDDGVGDFRDSIFTINEEEYEFAGFRIVRNLDDQNHLKEIIVGYFEYDESDVFTGFDNSLPDSSYTDNITDEDLEGIEDGVYPEYYVRAVFVKSNPTKSSNEGDYVLSSNSNTADTGTEPLPIELYAFNVEANQSSVTINWTTAAEINNDFFTIERSLDGRNWNIIGYIAGAGDSNSMLHYEFIDNNPVEGISYYRLKQTDFDGKFEYFDPVALQFGNKAVDVEILKIASNSNNIFIQLNNSGFEAVLDVVDLQGRVVYKNRINTSQNIQDISIGLPRSYSGEILMIRLYSNDGSDVRKVFVN